MNETLESNISQKHIPLIFKVKENKEVGACRE